MSKFLIPLFMVVALAGCEFKLSTAHNAEKLNNEFIAERCVSGYKFAQDRWGNAQPIQILDENGKGIRCDIPN